MKEEKGMIEYKEPKGFFQWIKSGFEKLKQRFRPKEEVRTNIEEGPGLTPEELEVVQGGFPDRNVLDYDELEANINKLKESKPWELDGEAKKVVEQDFEKRRQSYRQAEQGKQDEQELSEEDLDLVTAGQPILEDDDYSL